MKLSEQVSGSDNESKCSFKEQDNGGHLGQDIGS